MTVQFKASGVPLFKSDDTPAMNSDCCCGPCDLCGSGQASYTTITVTVDIAAPYCSGINGTFVYNNENFCAPFQPRIREVVQCTIPLPDGRTVVYEWEFVPSTGILTYREYVYFNYPSTSPLDEVFNTTIDLCPFVTDTYDVNSFSGASTITINFG